MKQISVNLNKNYDIFLGAGILAERLLNIDFLEATKVMVVTDATVYKLYYEEVLAVLKKRKVKVFCHAVKGGEQSKSLKDYSRLLNTLAKHEFTRKDLIIALGGGVVGDLAGFTAGTFLRGINYIQCPTTLLSMVDSSVGGKTGINLTKGKNLVGVFKQPLAVIADARLLSTLTQSEFKNGMGEVVKYEILFGGGFKREDLENPSENMLEEIIEFSINCKKKIVEKDEHESGERKLLNLGHTFAHAIEKIFNFSVPHGFAVIAGIKYILEVSKRLNVLKSGEEEKILNLLKASHDKLDYLNSTPPKTVLNAIKSDKKSARGKITLVLIEEIGKCKLHDISFKELGDLLPWIQK
ncbi:MAG: 3-dehydroquinate synthase [Firmicutes bacterium]|nr:3-dehydroquinate synthase [Bacillota bacterium]